MVVSDLHYACPGEQARDGHEAMKIGNPFKRWLLNAYRRYIWLHNGLFQNHLLEPILRTDEEPDIVVANGDFSSDTGFVGLADPYALESATLCIQKLRARFSSRLKLVLGDHEFGKDSMVAGNGGLRLESYYRAVRDLEIEPVWTLTRGPFVLIGVASSLIALPTYLPETLPDERVEWQDLRRSHLENVTQAFQQVREDQRIVLFCHDPTALPYLLEIPEIKAALPKISLTIIGHLHTPLLLKLSFLLAGMPTINFLGTAFRRMSKALGKAKDWKPFHVQICPSPTGCELLKDGGYLILTLPELPHQPIQVRNFKIPR
ncbi:MAG: hypothetical protein JWN25_3302 [Verrucomicrobiales bacterium]|nr:hypothetical protein [Verrucomicrobiales bacterium]